MRSRGNRYKGGKRQWKEQRPSFHIFCEGKNTEPDYFNSFPISNIAFCSGEGETTIKLVNTAIKYKSEQRITKKSTDQVWVVFDYDYDGTKQPKQKQDYNSAIAKAQANNIGVAFSNDSFELWYLLHFQNCRAQESRKWYNNQLSKKLDFKYGKEGGVTMKMYTYLLEYQADAIARAQTLSENYDLESDKAYSEMNPLTTVHLLVRELNKYIQ